MALASDIMTGGFSAVSARAIQGLSNAAVTAAGTTQGTATALTRSINAVTAGTGGVVLKSADIGDEQEVLNLSGAQITVYPPGSERINGLSASTGFLLANNTAVKVKKFSSTRWAAFLSA